MQAHPLHPENIISLDAGALASLGDCIHLQLIESLAGQELTLISGRDNDGDILDTHENKFLSLHVILITESSD